MYKMHFPSVVRKTFENRDVYSWWCLLLYVALCMLLLCWLRAAEHGTLSNSS